MPLGTGAGFLAGAGQGIADAIQNIQKQRQQQQEAAYRQLLIQQYLKKQQDEAQASQGFFGALSGLQGGAAGLAAPMPAGGDIGGRLPIGAAGFGDMMPSMGPPSSGSMVPGRALTEARASGRGGFDVPALYDLAVQAGYKPGEQAATAAAISMAESSGNPGAHNTQGEDSYGLMQLNADAHGDLARTLDPLQNMRNSLQVSAGGTNWNPWSVYKSGAYRQYLPAALAAARSGGGQPTERAGNGDGDGGSADSRVPGHMGAGPGIMPQGGIPAPLQQEAQQTAVRTAQNIPQGSFGSLSIQGLAQQIERSMPNASPAAKMMALDRLQKFMAPIQQQQWQMQRQDRQFQQQFNMEMMRDQEREASQKRLFEQQDKRQQKAEIEREQRAEKRNISNPVQVNAFDESGKVTYHGSAVYKKGEGWLDPQSNAPIPGRVELLGKEGTGAGGRSGAQVQRQVTSGREILSDIQNVVDLPITTTRGVFGGRTQGPGLMDALKENLAETLTSEDAELTNSAMAGLGRELSIIVSPVYGGHWASDQFSALNLKEGQTALVKLYNIARMRQTADNALETIEHTDWVGKETREDAKNLRGQLEKAVPWMPKDVLDYRRQGDDRQTFGDFVKQRGIGPAGKQKGGATQQEPGTAAVPPPPEAIQMLKNDPSKRQQFDEIFGAGAADRALGQ